MFSSKWLDFTGNGEADCSIVGSCSYGGAEEAGRTGEIRCTTVGSCSSGGIGEVRCAAVVRCSSGGTGDVPCATVGCFSGDSGWIVWAIVRSSSSGCTSATIKFMSMKSMVPLSLVSSPWHCLTCLSRLYFFWNLFWQYLQNLFCSCFFLFLLSQYNSLGASWCYAWYLHTSCNFPLDISKRRFLNQIESFLWIFWPMSCRSFMLVSVRIGSKCFVAASAANLHDYNEWM